MTVLFKRVFTPLLLSIIILAGLYIRVGSLANWLDNKERYFFDDQRIPLMLTVDSYYYLNIARDLQEGTYSDFDTRRQVPVGYRQPATPPLLSVLLARISSITGDSLEWVGLLLPAFLGVLLAIPVYLLSRVVTMKAKADCIREPLRRTSSKAAALTAAFFALLSPMFAGRSAVGWCDTDALNIFFPVLLVYLTIRLADAEQLKGRIAWFAGFAVSSLLFLWWWDQSHVPVFAFIAIPFAVACLFVGIRSRDNILSVILLGAVLVILIGYWQGFDLLNPLNYLDNLKRMTQYISSETGASPFRAAGEAVSEQSRTSAAVLVKESAGGWPGFLLACCGLLAFVWLSRGYIFYLTPLLVVAILSLKGQRFLIFTAPFYGLGLGTLVFMIFHLIRKPVWRLPVLVLLLVASSWGAFQTARLYERRVPRRLPVLFDAMQVLDEKTEKDAVVWASWGHGHPLLFYGQRAILADGMFHSAELQYVLTFPLAAESFRLSANWISFYVVHGSRGLRRANELFAGGRDNWAKGMAGLQELLTAGVGKSRQILQTRYELSGDDTEKTLQWLFPGNQRPVYLFLDYLLPGQAWYVLGRWDLAARSAPPRSVFLPIERIAASRDGIISGMSKLGKVTVDVKTGQVKSTGGTAELGVLKLHNGKRLTSKKYRGESPLSAEIFLPKRKGVIAGQELMNTLLVKLYYEYTYNRRYFKPIDVNNPYYAIWKVAGEQYRVLKK